MRVVVRFKRRGGAPEDVASREIRARTQNGHIRNDTRDVSRRMSSVSNDRICRRNRVADDRACTRVTPRNLHGKEGVDGSSPSEGFGKEEIPGNRGFLLPAMHHRAPPHYCWDRCRGRRASQKAPQIGLLRGIAEHLLETEEVDWWVS